MVANISIEQSSAVHDVLNHSDRYIERRGFYLKKKKDR
jgi:hypothetical protein